jgi:hypothetical protein
MGTCLALNSSKSDIYTTPNAEGERCILVVRAALGQLHETTVPMQLAVMPLERSDMRGPLSSVMALKQSEGGCVEHSDFIVYNSAATLAEFALSLVQAQA